MGFFGRPLRPSPADHVLYLRSPGSRHSSPLLSSLSSLHAHPVHHKVFTKNFCALSCGCLFRAPGRIHAVRRGHREGHSGWGEPWPGILAEPVYGGGRPAVWRLENSSSRQLGQFGVPESSLLGSLTAHTPPFSQALGEKNHVAVLANWANASPVSAGEVGRRVWGPKRADSRTRKILQTEKA